MPERRDDSLRHTVMQRLLLAVVLVLPLALAGCGDIATTGGSAEGAPSAGQAACARASRSAPTRTPLVAVDLDGDGTAEPVGYVPGTGSCPAHLSASVSGHVVSATLRGDLAVTAAGSAAVALPDRTGELLLVKASHPRGGFQAHLFGYADGRFAELTAQGRPVLDFVATDAMSTPTAARCERDGFAVLQARAHEPIGMVAAWDVYRTVYSVDANTVTRGATTEVADNVLDRELQRQYGDLVGYAFFRDCLAER